MRTVGLGALDLSGGEDLSPDILDAISIGGGEMISTSGSTVRIMPIRGNGYVPDANYYGWMPPVIT